MRRRWMLAGTKDRVAAAAADVVFAGAASVGTMLAVGVATSPFWATGGFVFPSLDAGSSVPEATITQNESPGWVTALLLGAALLVFIGLSGALSRSNRRTFGHQLSNASIVPLAAVGTRGHPDGAAAEDAVPARWRVALRWLLPLAGYVAVGSWSWTAAVAVVVLGWLPAIMGSRRSVYDRVAGVAVVQVTFLREDEITA